MAAEALVAWGVDSLRDPWVLFGFAAQFIFFSRFILQWYVSEREQRTVIPMSFWYLSILGAVMILIYAIERRDIVFIVGQFAALLIYMRNVVIAKRMRTASEPRANDDATAPERTNP